MRSTLLLARWLGVLTVVSQAHAQTVPAVPTPTAQAVEMVISSRKVEVRCGGSPDFYQTSELKEGDRVLVIGASDKYKGWYTIKPPAGSFSWINSNHVQKTRGMEAVVVAGDGATPVVPVLAGSTVTDKKPNVEVAKLAKGAFVVILDKGTTAEDGTIWLPIAPAPGEVRFIPSDSVKPLAPGQAPILSTGPAPAAAGGGLTPLAQANQAYQARDFARAKALYEQVARESKDANEQVYCYNQLGRIVTESQTAGPARPGYPAGTLTANTQAGQSTALYNTPVPGTNQQPSQALAASAAQWSGWGVLRKTAIVKDGQPLYVLENRTGNLPALYATTAPSLTLEKYNGQWICLFGTLDYINDDVVRAQRMVVSHVALPPGTPRR